MSKRDQFIQELGAAVFADEGLMDEPWSRLAIVVKFHESSSRLEAVAFTTDDDVPVAPENDGKDGVQGILARLRKLMAEEEKSKPFVACLVRIARKSGELDLNFEYDDADRWEFDPADPADKRAKLLSKD